METKPYQSNALHPDNLGLGRIRSYGEGWQGKKPKYIYGQN